MGKLKETNKSDIKLLYQLMKDVHQIFENNNVKYWVESGTLLGAVRHKGIIPWDDDLDIGMINTEYNKLKKLRPILDKCGYRLVKHWIGYKICYKNRKNIEDFDYSYPFLDIISYKKTGTKLVASLKDVRDTWPKYYFALKDQYPLKLYKFGDFKVYGPHTPESFFIRAYGKDWNEVAYREYDHKNEEEVESIKVKLTPKMKQSAKPIKTKNRQCVKNTK